MNENVLGYSVFSDDSDRCCDYIFNRIRKERRLWAACLNPHSYAVALRDGGFARAIHEADVVVPDGVGLVLASKFLGVSVKARITGSDIFHGLLARADFQKGITVFFLGSTLDVLEKIREKMSHDYPSVRVIGLYSPPFKDEFSSEELEEMVAVINSVSPDILWVGMTAPKQEKWIYENIGKLDIGFAGAIGAVFDFYAETVIRPNPFFQKIGLEWLVRLIRQPRKLWRRIFISAPVFIYHVLLFRLGIGK